MTTRYRKAQIARGDDLVPLGICEDFNEAALDSELPGILTLIKNIKEGIWPHTMDAQIWAKKWLEITRDKPEIALDEGAMIGWFANAIMAGYDTAMLRSTPEITRRSVSEGRVD